MTGAGGAPSVTARKVPKESGALSLALLVGGVGSSGSGKGTASSPSKDSMLAWLPEGAAGAGGTLYGPVESNTVGFSSPACMQGQEDFTGQDGTVRHGKAQIDSMLYTFQIWRTHHRTTSVI